MASTPRSPDLAADLTDVPKELRDAALAALAAAEVDDGHLAVQIVDPNRIRDLNREHRGHNQPTDVLAFPVDGTQEAAGPRELGDVVVCPQECSDLREAVVHGVLHLCGFDHEVDDGEMLARQAKAMATLQDARDPRRSPSPARITGRNRSLGGGRGL
jgi:probable rRNA maturation factor